jgi:hypothetical protein
MSKPLLWQQCGNHFVATATVLEKKSWDSGATTATVLDSWDSGATSMQWIERDSNIPQGVRWETSASDKSFVIGLSRESTVIDYRSIEFGIACGCNAQLGVAEMGKSKGTFGSYSVGDSFAVRVQGDEVAYYHNEKKFYTSLAKPTFPLVATSSFFHAGARAEGIYIEMLPKAEEWIFGGLQMKTKGLFSDSWRTVRCRFEPATACFVYRGERLGSIKVASFQTKPSREGKRQNRFDLLDASQRKVVELAASSEAGMAYWLAKMRESVSGRSVDVTWHHVRGAGFTASKKV